MANLLFLDQRNFFGVEFADLTAVIANINRPLQTVFSGEKSEIEKIIKTAANRGVDNVKLRVSNAIHSPLVQKASQQFKA